MRVICEQDGASERVLKQRLTALFKTRFEVERAYLTAVSYGSDRAVALLIKCTTGDSPELVGHIGRLFGTIFDTKEHLDVVFVSADQEMSVQTLCAPFF